MADAEHKVQVPPSTMQNISRAEAELRLAAQRLRAAGDLIRPYSARLQFKAADLEEQTTALRARVAELRGGLEVVRNA